MTHDSGGADSRRSTRNGGRAGVRELAHSASAERRPFGSAPPSGDGAASRAVSWRPRKRGRSSILAPQTAPSHPERIDVTPSGPHGWSSDADRGPHDVCPERREIRELAEFCRGSSAVKARVPHARVVVACREPWRGIGCWSSSEWSCRAIADLRSLFTQDRGSGTASGLRGSTGDRAGAMAAGFRWSRR